MWSFHVEFFYKLAPFRRSQPLYLLVPSPLVLAMDINEKTDAMVAQDAVGHAQLDVVPAELSRKQRLSSAFTIACAGFALISDGLQNNIMSLTNVVFKQVRDLSSLLARRRF